jgi:uncharacterized membrane protein (UPF0127 family)
MREDVLRTDLRWKSTEGSHPPLGTAAATTAPSPGGRRLPLSLIFAMLLGLGLSMAPLPVLAQTPQTLKSVDLQIGKATLHAQVAATPEERELGLMFYTKLGDNDGMIFLMGNPARATFWMKNTLIPLSVAFIDKNGIILDIHDMTPGDPSVPDNQLPITRSDSDQVAFALVTNLHWFALNGIKPGDKIDPPPGTLANTATP